MRNTVTPGVKPCVGPSKDGQFNLSHEAGCWALFTRGEKWNGRHAADATKVTQGFISCTLSMPSPALLPSEFFHLNFFEEKKMPRVLRG
jgi:hypothetical protein